jgi:hypothetical protein
MVPNLGISSQFTCRFIAHVIDCGNLVAEGTLRQASRRVDSGRIGDQFSASDSANKFFMLHNKECK